MPPRVQMSNIILPYRTAQVSPTVRLAYIDSWHNRPVFPPKYKTVIALHGIAYNSAVWTPLIPAFSDKVRFIAYNQRNYAGSSPAFEPKEPGATDATAAYLGDLLGFVKYVVDDLKVPALDPDTADQGESGISLLGWSKGTILPIALLSYLSATRSSARPLPPFLHSKFPATLTDPLLTHLSSIILFEPPGSVLGRALTPDFVASNLLHLISSPEVPQSELAVAFEDWVGAFSGTPAQLASLPKNGLDTIPDEVKQAAYESGQVRRSFAWRLSPDPAVVRDVSVDALAPSQTDDALLSRLRLGLIYGTRTVGYCLDAATTLAELWKSREQKRTEVITIEETGHFAFAHKPEEFARAVEKLL